MALASCPLVPISVLAPVSHPLNIYPISQPLSLRLSFSPQHLFRANSLFPVSFPTQQGRDMNMKRFVLSLKIKDVA